MIVYNLSCAHVSVGTSSGMGLGYEQNNEPTVPDDTLEPITMGSKGSDVKTSHHKIIVQPVVRKIANEI